MTDLLVLTTCSNAKVGGGRSYEPGHTMWDHLPSTKRSLGRRRRAAIAALREARRRYRPVRELPYNARLVDGADFGGEETTGVYLPAWRRYSGRFYREIPQAAWKKPQVDVLIVSGLYGILPWDEPIQRYSFHLQDCPRIAQLWAQDNLLTDVVTEWIRSRRIKRVLNLCGDPDYTALIDWSKLSRASETLHPWGDQDEGAALLPALGSLFAALAKPGKRGTLSRFKEGARLRTKYGELTLSREAPVSILEEHTSSRSNESRATPVTSAQVRTLANDLTQVEFSKTAVKQCSQIPPDIKPRVFKALGQLFFQQDAEGLGLEQVTLRDKTKVLRVRLNQRYRMHLKREGGSLVVLAVGDHSLQGIG